MGLWGWLKGDGIDLERAMTVNSFPTYGSQPGTPFTEYRDDGAGPQSVPDVTKRVSPRNALSLIDAYACVRLLSDSIGSLPLKVYRRTDAGRVEAGPQQRIRQLLQRPEAGSTSVDLIAQVVASLNLNGNSYVGKLRDPGTGEIAALTLLDPDRVVPIRSGLGIRYEYSPVQGGVQTLTPLDVVHVKGMSTDGVVGISPVTACRLGLSINASTAWHARQFFQNGARPSGLLTAPGEQDRDSFARFVKEWSGKHSGVDNHHRVAAFAGEASYTPISFSAADAQFLESRELAATEVARLFGVPPWCIGAKSGDSLTYSTVAEQNRALATHSLRPWCVRIERALSSDPELCPGSTYVEFSMDALLRAAPESQASIYTAALNPQTGWMRREEVRALENLPPEDVVAVTEPELGVVATTRTVDNSPIGGPNGHHHR